MRTVFIMCVLCLLCTSCLNKGRKTNHKNDTIYVLYHPGDFECCYYKISRDTIIKYCKTMTPERVICLRKSAYDAIAKLIKEKHSDAGNKEYGAAKLALKLDTFTMGIEGYGVTKNSGKTLHERKVLNFIKWKSGYYNSMPRWVLEECNDFGVPKDYKPLPEPEDPIIDRRIRRIAFITRDDE